MYSNNVRLEPVYFTACVFGVSITKSSNNVCSIPITCSYSFSVLYYLLLSNVSMIHTGLRRSGGANKGFVRQRRRSGGAA
jgi:hypothetical protein